MTTEEHGSEHARGASQAIDGAPTGIGLGLRWAFLDEVLDPDEDAAPLPAALRFFEVSPENYMRRGGYFPSALHEIGARHRLITHGLMMNIGGRELDREYLDQLRGFLGELSASYHSDHLCWTGHDARCLHDLLPLPLDAGAARRVADNVRRVQDHLGVPMALENISYYAAPGLRPDEGAALEAIEQAFLCEVLERADCKLLLDVNNVHVNATNHGFDAWRFIAGLPLERVIQLHVAGGERRPHLDDLIIDTHGADVSPAVQELMARVIERLGPLPVLYERDHSIPPLPELLDQVTALDRVYQDALARHRQRPPERPRPRERAPATGHDMGSVDGFQRGLSRYILDDDPKDRVQRDAAGYFSARGLDARDIAAITRLGPARLEVYRRLPRGGIRGTIEDFLPRTIARLDAAAREHDGAATFDAEFRAWMAGPGPRSRYLRDLPTEFVAWAGPRWLESPTIPNYLADLARHELVDFAVAAAPQKRPQPGDEPVRFSLDARLEFAESTRLVHYQYAIHELAADRRDRAVPRREPTHLLVYRDRDFKPRYLQLSELASAVVERLLHRGQTVREALIEGARDVDASLDDEVLGRMSVLLADLGERGLVRPARAD